MPARAATTDVRPDTFPETPRPASRRTSSSAAANDVPQLPLVQPFRQRINRQQLAPRRFLVGFRSHCTCGWAISQRPPMYFGWPENSTVCPRVNFSIMHGWLNHTPRRYRRSASTSTPTMHRPGPVLRISNSSTLRDDALQLPLFQIVNRPQVRQVLVIAGKEKNHVPRRSANPTWPVDRPAWVRRPAETAPAWRTPRPATFQL